MLTSFLITLREGLEAALIIGIMLAFLAKSGKRQMFSRVWIGTAAAVIVSLAAGAVVFSVAGSLEGRAEKIFEGGATILAAAILTWMIIWMRRQAVNLKAEIQDNLNQTLIKGSTLGLVGLAFVAVVREGIETVLFIFASMRGSESAGLSIAGALLGLVIAVGGGYLIYRGTSRLNLKAFFNVTSLVLVLFAAGFLAYGVHELQEAAVLPTLVEHVWDINHFLPEKSVAGRFLTALFGYNGNPSLIEVAAYVVYMAVALATYFMSGLKGVTSALKKDVPL